MRINSKALEKHHDFTCLRHVRSVDRDKLKQNSFRNNFIALNGKKHRCFFYFKIKVMKKNIYTKYKRKHVSYYNLLETFQERKEIHNFIKLVKLDVLINIKKTTNIYKRMIFCLLVVIKSGAYPDIRNYACAYILIQKM